MSDNFETPNKLLKDCLSSTQNLYDLRMTSDLLSVIIPAFNEEEGISRFIHQVINVDYPLKSLEVIVVNDGSTDRTQFIVDRISEIDPRVRSVELARNSGHMAALTAGFLNSKGDWVVTIDADGQDDPELIPEMLNKCLISHSDICYMKRKDRKHDPLRHRIFSPLFYKLMSSFTGGLSPYQAADFRMVSKRVVNVINKLPEVNRVYRVLIPALGFPSTTMTYERKSRIEGKSKYGFRKLATLGLSSVLATSGAPLRWVGLISIFGAILGVLLSLIAIINGLFIHSLPGWSSLALLISILFTFQSFTSFVICEFLLVIIGDLRKRPIFQLKEDHE